MSGRPPIDDELDDILKRPSDVAFAQRLHEGAKPVVEVDPAFKEALRRRLMQEAWRQKEPRRPWYRRLLGPPGLAWAGAMAGVLLIVFATVALSQNTSGHDQQTFSSPINGNHQVVTTASIIIHFPQPMNQQTTEAATMIHPATEANFKWSNNNQTLTITPKNGALAPSQPYEVTFAASATTASNQPLTSGSSTPASIQFVTAPQPVPTPAPTPAPTTPVSPTPAAAPTPLTGTRELGASAATPPVWAQDGTLIYVIGPGGSLTSYPSASGSGTPIAASGVTQVLAGPQGAAYLEGTAVTFAGQTTNVPGATAIGFEDNGQQLVAVAGTTVAPVVGGSGTQPETLKEAPTGGAVQFAPDGSGNLAYLAADGLHLYAPTGGGDQILGPATALGSWSPDGSEFAYINQGNLEIAEIGSGQPTTQAVSGLTGVTSVSWSANGLLVADSSGLQQATSVNGGSSAQTMTLTSSASAADGAWAPVSDGLAYVQGGDAYVASLTNASAAATAYSTVAQFMKFREEQDATDALALLAGSARQSALNLTSYGSETLNQWSVILKEPSGLIVTKTVFGQGNQESIFYESFQVTLSSNGTSGLITGASATQINKGTGDGPVIESISVTSPTSVTVKFVSDLDPSTVAAGIDATNAAGTVVSAAGPVYTVSDRTVGLTFSQPLQAGQTYSLVLSSALKDVEGNAATAATIAFTATATPAPTASPSPSPADTPSPTPSN